MTDLYDLEKELRRDERQHRRVQGYIILAGFALGLGLSIAEVVGNEIDRWAMDWHYADERDEYYTLPEYESDAAPQAQPGGMEL